MIFANNMNTLFNSTKQSMEKLEQNNSSIVFSSLSEFYEPVQSCGFAVKYVVEGSELYTLDNQQHYVKAGNYLLCNSSKSGHVEIESRSKVKGICVNINNDVMLDVVASLQKPDTAFADKTLGIFFSTPYFLETQYKDTETVVGKCLQNISKQAQTKEIVLSSLNEEFFYYLAENIVRDQIPVFKQLQVLPSIKPATKRDLYKRIIRGKEMMDAYYKNAISIQDIAKEACMSEYHFFRLFKKMMGVSPHQYILQKRLQFGKQMLQDGKESVSTIAIEAGFTDIFAFSKAFKNKFGVTPSSLLNK